MIVAEYLNTETGIRSVVVAASDGLFDVAAFDVDAEKMIEARHGFPTQAGAVEYAEKFVADKVPTGVFVPL